MTTQISVGHVMDKLREIPSESVHMVWTSPPYYGLRSYGTEPQVWPSGWSGEHGLEPTFDLWLQHEVEIFREVRRVLRGDGTLWLNCGDAYASSVNGRSAEDTKEAGNDDRAFRDKPVSTVGGVFKPKDRMMMPHRLAIALQEDGWWVRDEIIWRKPNPMPSSVRDRTTPAHEMLFLLSKKARYYFDQYAIMEPCSDGTHARLSQATIMQQQGGAKQDAYESGFVVQRARSRRPNEIIQALAEKMPVDGVLTRNRRSVWDIVLEPFDGAHFATAPTQLVQPCIQAGTSDRGVCPHCGAPWRRVIKRSGGALGQDWHVDKDEKESVGHSLSADARTSANDGTYKVEHTGWEPGCKCEGNEPVPATVLDPFFGAGTTGLVADLLGRNAIGIELNPAYAAIARKRLRENLGRVQSEMPEDRPDDLPLFGVVV